MQWDETNLDNIFKMSARLIYNTKEEDNSDDINFESDECKNYLEILVRINVKRNIVSGSKIVRVLLGRPKQDYRPTLR